MLKHHRYINKVQSSRTRRALMNAMDTNQVDTVPTAGNAGYHTGMVVSLKDPAAGQAFNWLNIGDEQYCTFVPIGMVNGYGFYKAGARGGTNGSATEIIDGPDFSNTDIAIAGHIKSDDGDFIKSVAMTDDEGEVLITASADPSTTHGYLWGVLRNYCEPSWDIVYAGTHTTVGGAAAEAITVTGVLATDIALACLSTTDDTDAIKKTVCTANTITVTLDNDPGETHAISYMVLRPRGNFKPSHYVFAADSAVATVADATSEYENTITVTGAATTDLAFAVIESNAGTLEIARAEVTAANTLTIEFSANPSTTSTVSYIILRSY